MQNILINQNPHWTESSYSGLIPRRVFHALRKKITTKEIQILHGIRRSGKSVIFKLLINALMEDHSPRSILYLNLDDPFFVDLHQEPKLLYEVIDAAEKITNEKIRYLFLDEIQNVEGWERFVKSVYDSELFTKIFITGSNSKLLASEYTKLLSGRYFDLQIYPLSFSEILEEKGIKTPLDLIKNRVSVLHVIDSLLHFGSFPRVYLESEEIKRDILVNYYNTILLKDCIADNTIKDTKSFKQLAHYLVTNISSRYSYRSLSSTIGINEKTIKQFVSFLEAGYLLEEITGHSFSLKKQIKSQKKLYCIDNGLVYANSFNFSKNQGKLFENLIYTELRKNSNNEIYLFHEQHECDFIIKREEKFIPIQSCFELNPNNINREKRGLKNAMRALGVDKGYIITYNQEEALSNEMEAISFAKFFSGFFI